MKQVTFAAGLLALGLALGLIMPGVLAQAPQGEVQKWEQFCEMASLSPRKGMDDANASAEAHGKRGYELVSGAPWGGLKTFFLCYRRPAR